MGGPCMGPKTGCPNMVRSNAESSASWPCQVQLLGLTDLAAKLPGRTSLGNVSPCHKSSLEGWGATQ